MRRERDDGMDPVDVASFALDPDDDFGGRADTRWTEHGPSSAESKWA